MVIGERLRAIREDKGLSQGDIEAKTGAVKATGEGLSKMEQRQVESLNKKFLKLPRRERGIVHALISKMVAVAR